MRSRRREAEKKLEPTGKEADFGKRESGVRGWKNGKNGLQKCAKDQRREIDFKMSGTTRHRPPSKRGSQLEVAMGN